MANQETVTNWILGSRKVLDLQVTKLTWIDHHFPGQVDLAVSIIIDGEKYEGRGSSQNEDVALGKAVCEAIERHVCVANKIGSTGVAGHFDEAMARENAKAELEERKSLFLHLNGAPTVAISKMKTYFKVGTTYIPAEQRIYQMSSSPGRFAYLSLVDFSVDSGKFGALIGLGYGGDKLAAREKSEIELLRNVSALATDAIKVMPEEEFAALVNPNGTDRRSLLFHPEYARKVFGNLNERQEIINRPLFENADLIFTKLSSSALDRLQCPLKFWQCRHASESFTLEFVG